MPTSLRFSSQSSQTSKTLTRRSCSILFLPYSIALGILLRNIRIEPLISVFYSICIFELCFKICNYLYLSQLYTCAAEFNFLGWEMPYKVTLTLLLPAAALAIAIVLANIMKQVGPIHKTFHSIDVKSKL